MAFLYYTLEVCLDEKKTHVSGRKILLEQQAREKRASFLQQWDSGTKRLRLRISALVKCDE